MGNVAEIRSLLIIEQYLSNVYAYIYINVRVPSLSFVFKRTTANNNQKKYDKTTGNSNDNSE